MVIKTSFRLLLISCLLICGFSAQAQTARVLYSSKELQITPQTTGIKKITRTLTGPFIRVHYLDGSKNKIPVNDIWGYVDQYGQICRQFKKDFFQINDQSDGIEYKEFYVASAGRIPMVHTSYYYSRDLDSPIYKHRKDALSSR